MKKYLFLIVLPFLPVFAHAYDKEIGGIYYNFNYSNLTASVTYRVDWESYNQYKNDISIPESVNYKGTTFRVTSIGDRAFKYSSPTSVDLPCSITSIGEEAFRGCVKLTSLTIPDGVTSIGKSAFYYCGLTSLTIPKSVTSIGVDAFGLCKGLTSLIVDNSNKVYDSRSKCNAIIETCSNKLIAGCKNTIIPKSVTSIGYCAFNGSGLTSITIPNSVTSIGGMAFANCHMMTSLSIPNSVTSIGEYAFAMCQELKSIRIPNSVTSIGKYAFEGCRGLTSLTIPYSVSLIEDGVCKACSGLTSVTIPNSVTAIGELAFDGCSGLTSITIPNSVTTIGKRSFETCTGLTSVVLGNSIKVIEYGAFAYNRNMENVYCYAINCPVIDGNGFENITNLTLHVPSASITQYRSQKPWSDFKAIVPIEKTEPKNVVLTTGYATYYDKYFDTALPAGMKASVVTGATDMKLTYKVIANGDNGEIVPAGTAVLLQGKQREADSYTLTPKESTTTYTGKNLLHGSDDATMTTAGSDCLFYKLAYGPSGTALSNTIGWFWGEEDGKPFSIDGNKAWLAIPKGSSVKSRTLFYSIDGNAIELETLEISTNDKVQGTTYDLSGRRVDQPSQRGIYIRDGKKVLVK